MKNFVKTALASLLFVSMWGHASDSQQQQIDALKAEIALLKHAMMDNKAPQMMSEQVISTEKSTLALKTKSGAQVQLYGFVRADAAYQIEGGKGIFNSIHNVALEGEAHKQSTEDRLDSTLTTTRIGLDFKAPVQDTNVGAKIEIDFRGGADKDTVRLRHVYLTYDHWLIGQTTSNFLSTETSPEMLDFNTALGGGTTRTPMLRYTNQLNSTMQYFLALEKGNDENRLPSATAKISHKFADGLGRLTARGLLQEVRIRTLDDQTEWGWGVGLGIHYKPIEQLSVNANYSHLSGDNKLLLATSDNKRYLQARNNIKLIDFDALQIGTTYQFNEKLRSTLGYGVLIYQDKDQVSTNANKKLQQGWINMMYNPYKPLTFGMEYVYGERNTVNDLAGKDHRLEIMAKYDF